MRVHLHALFWRERLQIAVGDLAYACLKFARGLGRVDAAVEHAAADVVVRIVDLVLGLREREHGLRAVALALHLRLIGGDALRDTAQAR